MPRNVTAFGEQVIVAFEGLRLKAYRCSAGHLTIGVGQTSMAGKPVVTAGMTITRDEAFAILRRDLDVFEAGVERLLTRQAKDHEFDAMVSLAFNIGLGNFRSSSVLRVHNKGNTAGAAMSFAAWSKARVGGKLTPLPGLVRRRASEALVYQGTKDLDFDGRRDPGEPVYGDRYAFADGEAEMVELAFMQETVGGRGFA